MRFGTRAVLTSKWIITFISRVQRQKDKLKAQDREQRREGVDRRRRSSRALTRHLPVFYLNSHHTSWQSRFLTSGVRHELKGVLTEISRWGLSCGSWWATAGDAGADEWPLPLSLGGVGSVTWGSGGVSLAQPECAMLMMTDALQLDVLTGPKALCH